MDEKFYQMFYTRAVLPQFGLKELDAVWGERKVLGPDESAYPFRIRDTHYVLIYEDYDGLGRNEDFLKEHVVGLKKYEFVKPISKTAGTPSYTGFHLPVPYQYVRDITGSFTLIKFLEDEEK